MTRDPALSPFWANPISKRYIIRASSAKRWEPAVYDQREKRFVPDDEIERIDPDEMLKI